MNRRTKYTSRWVGLAVSICAAGAVLSPLGAAEARATENSSPLLNLAPSAIFGSSRRDRHVLDEDKPVVRRTDEEGERKPQAIYFPPHPPPLGVELALHKVDARLGGPAELAPHVMEPFYAPLSTRLLERSLQTRQEEALERYTERKATLLEALRVRLRELALVDGTSRRRALEELAGRQAPALAELEHTADAMREDFFSMPVSASRGDWYQRREWKLGRGALDRPREQTLFFEGRLLRAAAFYQPGLSPAQRLLLRECAMELEAVVFPGAVSEAPSADDWFWYFSPHLARVHLPDDLPRALIEAIATFRADKGALKAALRDAVYEADRAWFASGRRQTLAEVARAQAPQVEALEQQAEAIRRQLAGLALMVPPPAPPSVPPGINALLADYAQEKKSLERLLAARVRAALRAVRTPDSYAPHPTIRQRHEDRHEAMDRAREQFRVDHAERLVALATRLQELRTAVEAWAGTGAAGMSSASDHVSFLRDFFARRGEQQGRHELHLAVFEPGMSPAQRRLLFGAAIVALDLPLPGPEDQPTNLPATMLK